MRILSIRRFIKTLGELELEFKSPSSHGHISCSASTEASPAAASVTVQTSPALNHQDGGQPSGKAETLTSSGLLLQMSEAEAAAPAEPRVSPTAKPQFRIHM